MQEKRHPCRLKLPEKRRPRRLKIFFTFVDGDVNHPEKRHPCRLKYFFFG